MTSRTWSLAQLIALPYAPPKMLQLAAATGCAGVGIRLLPTTPVAASTASVSRNIGASVISG